MACARNVAFQAFFISETILRVAQQAGICASDPIRAYLPCFLEILTLKYEEVLRGDYRDLHEAQLSIRDFLEKVYNAQRLHSALGYVPPAEFEANLATQHKDAATRRLSV